MPYVVRQAVTPTAPVDLSTNAPSILAINGFFCGLAILVVGARMFVRIVMLKTVGPDDFLICLAAICGIGVTVCFVGETHHGVGMHTASIPLSDFVPMFHYQYFHSLIVTLGISLIKLSIAFFLLRLVPGKNYKIFLYCMIAFLVAFTLSSEGTIAFSCIPISASWDKAGAPQAKCFSSKTFTAIGLFNSSVNIATDVLFATLPIPMVYTLQVNLKTKLTLVAILSLGYFACTAAIIKTVLQTTVLTNPDSTRNDSYMIWNSIELYVGILASSLPALRPLFKSILSSSSFLSSYRKNATSGAVGSRGLTGGGVGTASRHKYYMQDEEYEMNSKGGAKYDVRISGKGLGTGTSKTTIGDGDSVESILPMQGRSDNRGITRTVDVRIS